MPEEVNVALAQLGPRLRGTEANIETMREVVSGHPEADLIVFPELFLSGYVLDGIEEIAARPDGLELQSIAKIAKESSTALVFGAPEVVEGGVANSSLCVEEHGTVAVVYRKVQLFGVSADGEVEVRAGSSEAEIPGVRLHLPARSSVRQAYLRELRTPMPGVRDATPAAEQRSRT
jgi:predicted amidohydrolase